MKQLARLFGKQFARLRQRRTHSSPPYSGDEGDGEPPFLSEWIEADTSLEVLGRTCLSMLSASLELYFKQWEAELGLSCRHDHKKQFKQSGFLRGYRACFSEAVGESPGTNARQTLRYSNKSLLRATDPSIQNTSRRWVYLIRPAIVRSIRGPFLRTKSEEHFLKIPTLQVSAG